MRCCGCAVADQVVLGLRSRNIQETLVHELAGSTGAYAAQGLAVTVTAAGEPDGLTVGVASALYEVAAGTGAWDVLLVVCTAPLFWVSSRPVAPALTVPVNPTISFLLRLALPGATPEDLAVLGPAALVEIAAGRLHVAVDVGGAADFPAIGLAGRRGVYDPDVALRVVRAHVAALAEMHRDPSCVAGLLTRHHGVAAADLDDVVAILRSRFREVPPAEAVVAAVRGADRAELDTDAVAGAFAPTPEGRSWN